VVAEIQFNHLIWIENPDKLVVVAGERPQEESGVYNSKLYL
jgi:hypothetical protein